MNRHLKILARPRAAAVLIVTALILANTISPVLSRDRDDQKTDTPIKHVVVIFQENVSFDHYFASYPIAKNPGSEPNFRAKAGTPTVNGLNIPLLTSNPNAAAPFRLDRSQAALCDQDHSYTHEQQAYDGGLVDKFVEFTGNGGPPDGTILCKASDTMGYYDGDTVTALWNYAQRFAMSDNSFNTTFGPSTPGALNLIAGQTHGITLTSGDVSQDIVNGNVIEDPQPLNDICDTREAVQLSGQNVGDLLNAHGITWGWFQGDLQIAAPNIPVLMANSRATTLRTMSRSSISLRRRIRNICRQRTLRRSATTARPTTSTIWPTFLTRWTQVDCLRSAT